MGTQTIRIHRSVSWGDKAARIVLAAALLLPVVLILPGMAAPASAQPALLEMAAESPDSVVSVIAQMAGDSGAAEDLVNQLGGRVTKDLTIINAFAAELSARAARELAGSPLIRWVSLDAPVEESDTGQSAGVASSNTYLDTLRVQPVWDMGYDGSGIGVAIIDSGISKDDDFSNLWARKSFNDSSRTVNDVYGHGTHVAGIVGGSGKSSNGQFSGVAPGAHILGLKISDENGMAYESDIVEAMQWVLFNKDSQNIRVVNLSINSTVETSYHQSPMAAAAEILWFNGIVVVASVGNSVGGDGLAMNTINAAPANDPFIITVGAANENGDAYRGNDTMAPFSAVGTTMDGYDRPEIFAPGKDIYSVLSKDSSWDTMYPARCDSGCDYFRLSGSSMAAPMVSGAVALLLQAEPELTPDQVKYRLMHASGSILGDGADPASYPYLDIYAAVTGTTTESANTGINASQLLWTGSDPVTWDSVSWNSVSWSSVSWSSVSWSSVSWSSVSWSSVSWNE